MRGSTKNKAGGWTSLVAASSVALAACGGAASASDAGPTPDASLADTVLADTGECVPVTHVCVTDEFGMPAPGATVTATRTGEIPHQGETAADGCVALYPEAGSWDLRARTTSNCQNPAYTLEVTGCGEMHVSLMATECFDG
jgi:hypothetical protein